MTDFSYDSVSLSLKVTHWYQTVRNNGLIDPTEPQGMSIDATCTAVDDHQLYFSNNDRLRDLDIVVNIADTPYRRGDGQPPERGIGTCNYFKAPAGRSGIIIWFSFDRERYKAIWAQFSHGAFAESSIEVELAPLDRLKRVWDVQGMPLPQPLLVLSAAVIFSHRTRPSPQQDR